MKPGHRTTEFLVSAGTIIGTLVAAFEGNVSAPTAAKVSAVVAGLYALARGFAKNGTPGA